MSWPVVKKSSCGERQRQIKREIKWPTKYVKEMPKTSRNFQIAKLSKEHHAFVSLVFYLFCFLVMLLFFGMDFTGYRYIHDERNSHGIERLLHILKRRHRVNRENINLSNIYSILRCRILTHHVVVWNGKLFARWWSWLIFLY